ncbi:MAG TPA: hypothetical protein VN775_12270 [Opitutaceae bacterium]|nr:hypothetical protein [Opitutaceae bacterium]
MNLGKNAVVILVSCTLLMVATFILLAVESKGAIVESRFGFVFAAVIALLVFLTVFFIWLGHPKDPPSPNNSPKRLN